MSSMFKKRGGLAFKPKIPSARPRPPINPATQPTRNVEEPPQADPTLEDPSVEAPEIGQTQPSRQEVESEPAAPVVLREELGVPQAPPPPPEQANAPSESESISQTPSQPLPEVDRPETPVIADSPQPEAPSQSNQVLESARQDTVPEPELNTELAVIVQDSQEVLGQSKEQHPTEPSTISDEATETTPPTSASELAAPRKSTRRSTTVKKSGTSTPSDDTAQPKKRQRKTKRNHDNADGEPDGEGSQAPAKRRRKPQEGEGEAKSRRARSVTPEDAETQIVDHQKLTMADLTKDLHIGKKFSRHDELRERERQARIKAKLEKESDGAEEAPDMGDVEGSPVPSNGRSPSQPAESTPPEPQQGSGVQFRMVDGQIVLDQSSLVMDRHARAVAAQQDMETIEENDFTRLITSSSFMNSSKLKGPNIWTAEETVLFYRGLAMFGTDFQMIAGMFPDKQRRQVKLKFNREERYCPKLIDAALIGKKTVQMNIDEYKALTGTEFESVESIEAQQRKVQEDFEAQQKRRADEQAEAMRKKREELFADDDGTNNNGTDYNQDDNEGKKKKKGKKKKRHDNESNGGEEVILGDL